MNHESKKLIRKQRQNDRDYITQYRDHLQQSLEAACVDNGGHAWTEWFNVHFDSVTGLMQRIECRHCGACGKEEER